MEQVPTPQKLKVSSIVEFEARTREFFRNAPGPNRNKYMVVLQVAGEPYWYPVARADSHRRALDLACLAHAGCGYPFPSKLGALVYGGSDTPETTLDDQSKRMEFVVEFTPAAA